MTTPTEQPFKFECVSCSNFDAFCDKIANAFASLQQSHTHAHDHGETLPLNEGMALLDQLVNLDAQISQTIFNMVAANNDLVSDHKFGYEMDSTEYIIISTALIALSKAIVARRFNELLGLTEPVDPRD